ncbi:IS701 family transposase [Streptomyces coelicoflavus]|uniref:IS701 family transposase n=1 Tax=Streptomyces coelicoflavus TaxID=285562 RepID=UPI00369DE8A7
MSVTGLGRPQSRAQRQGFVPETLMGELSTELFASMPRSDQRRKGELYLRGLLTAEGRKSIRNIAACVGDRAAEQSLHHFIASSTWAWSPVRAALARSVERALRPAAWVVRPVVISKSGTESVGVARRFISDLGQMVNSQIACGVWGVGEDYSCPLNWRLALGKGDEHPTALAAYASEASLTTSLERAVSAVLELRGWVGEVNRPVLLDLPGVDPAAAVRQFAGTGTRLVIPVRGSTRVRCVDPAVPGGGACDVAAHQLLLQVRTLRRPVTWTDPDSLRTRTSLVAVVRVCLSQSSPPVLLLGEWDDPRGWPERCWVSDLTGTTPGALLRLSKLPKVVERDFEGISRQVGLTDFGGRSFEGWHRHTTLASAAHAVRTITLAETEAFRRRPDRSAYGAHG